MEERPVHGGDEARNRPSGVQPPGLTEVLADMLRSALEWEDANGVHAAADKNGNDVTGPWTPVYHVLPGVVRPATEPGWPGR